MNFSAHVKFVTKELEKMQSVGSDEVNVAPVDPAEAVERDVVNA
jgi:hypothetical protein